MLNRLDWRANWVLIGVSMLLISALALTLYPISSIAEENASHQQAKATNITGKANIKKLMSVSVVSSTINPGWEKKLSSSTSAYDVTGDARADKVDITLTGYVDPYANGDYAYNGLPSYVQGIKISINGISTLKIKPGETSYCAISLITLKNGKVLWLVSTTPVGLSVREHTIYEFRNGKLKKSITNSSSPFSERGTILKVKAKGNALRVTYEGYSQYIGKMQATFNFKYKGTRLKLANGIVDNLSYWGVKNNRLKLGLWTCKTTQRFDTFTTPTCKKRAFTVKKGAKVKVVSAKSVNGTLALKVKNGKKTGWVKSEVPVEEAFDRSLVMTGKGIYPIFDGCRVYFD